MDATTSGLLEKAVNSLVPPVWYLNFGLWGVILNLVNVIVLVATAVIIFWYARETQKLRIEAQKTNKYAFRPIIVAKYLYSQSGGMRELKVKNIGKGPALNIESRISQIHSGGGYTNLQELIPNEKFNNMSADEDQRIRRITTIDLYSNAMDSGFSHGVPNKFVIIFTYQDVAEFKYQTIILIEVIEGTPVLKKTIADEYNSGTLKNIL